ncbi:hypothetical protein PRUPE_5G044600 [Prunus persica]|uniref:Uncharacterized protein n=1 Tax=Prunus persica TaxID=3760 RepID=M5WTH0_PRUPE|nr:hypothetical protein PRUPE_5G044600 [Prunus persica]
MDSRASWCPPRLGFIKVNIDGAWADAASSAGFGVILRDSTGAFCGGTAGPNSCESALMSEAEAALSGLKLAAQFGHHRISWHLIPKAWTILPIIKDIRKLAASFVSSEWCWAPRSQNMAAHEAAKLGRGLVEARCWLNRAPLALMHVLNSDGLPGPP